MASASLQKQHCLQQFSASVAHGSLRTPPNEGHWWKKKRLRDQL